MAPKEAKDPVLLLACAAHSNGNSRRTHAFLWCSGLGTEWMMRLEREAGKGLAAWAGC